MPLTNTKRRNAKGKSNHKAEKLAREHIREALRCRLTLLQKQFARSRGALGVIEQARNAGSLCETTATSS